MEVEMIRELKSRFPTMEAQQAQLTRLVDEFSSVPDAEAQYNVGDILCLAK